MIFIQVIFEGLDNCGKTTLVQLIKEYYLKLRIDTEISKEFETNIGLELKKMAKQGTLDSILKAYLSILDKNNLIYINEMQPIENIFGEVIEKIEEFRIKNERRI